uniref:sensor histidine kinase n=1 Tax=Acetatifactor sp. TaxID=1872090 RepID=UPI00405729E0
MNSLFNKLSKRGQHIFSILFSFVCMGLATSIAFLYYHIVPDHSANIALIFILALVIVSRYTVGYFYGIICCLFAVVCINYLFTYPYFKINFTLTGYPITFIGMGAVTLITSALTSHLTMQAKVIAEREKLLAEAEKEKMRANLLRAISHDLRTPLTGIIGNSSVFLENQNRLSEKEKTDIVSTIYNDSNWLLNMVENLLTVTRIKGDNLTINTSEEPLEEVISEALQKLHKRYPNTKIEVQIPEEFILLPMDAILIEQVTINLLENAVIHAQSTQPIQLLVTDHPTIVSFTIKDYGIGLPAEMLDNLFDSTTYTPSGAPDAHRGMGIGLSICKTIITAHHGTLTGRNHTEGAEFIFTLPKTLNTNKKGSNDYDSQN